VSNRIVRINELVQREINDILRHDYQSETVAMTVTEVRVAPDLRDARVFVSIVGDEQMVEAKFRWLRRMAPKIRAEVARRVTIKFLPRFEYVLDSGAAQSVKILKLLDDLGPVPAPDSDPNERSS
jgi:ribosome-binding factor A